MTENKFNLSEKICKPIPNWEGIYIEDVKEFIRLLKGEIKKSIISQQQSAYSIIDKLAGEKLKGE